MTIRCLSFPCWASQSFLFSTWVSRLHGLRGSQALGAVGPVSGRWTSLSHLCDVLLISDKNCFKFQVCGLFTASYSWSFRVCLPYWIIHTKRRGPRSVSLLVMFLGCSIVWVWPMCAGFSVRGDRSCELSSLAGSEFPQDSREVYWCD